MMKIENFNKVENKMKGLGFREPDHIDSVKEKIPKQDGRFSVNITKEFESKKVDFKLSFNSQSNKLYLNKIEVNNSGKKIELNPNFTSKEMFNLTESRAVNKDFLNKQNEKINAWVTVDFKDEKPQLKYFNESYNFKIDDALNKYPEIRVNEATKAKVIESIKKGNAQVMDMEGNKRIYIAANPQFKNLIILNEKKERLFQKLEGGIIKIGSPIKAINRANPEQNENIKATIGKEEKKQNKVAKPSTNINKSTTKSKKAKSVKM